MSQVSSQKPTTRFNKGLVTEAGELTFPEGASVDELNCSLERDGSRRRRLGLEYEANFTTSGSVTVTSEVESAVQVWKNAGAVAGLTFVVVQAGSRLHFYREAGGALSQSRESFTVNLDTYVRPTGFGSSTVTVQTASIQGRLIVASSEIDTIVVSYNDSTNTISSSRIDFRIRDFEWLGNRANYNDATNFPTLGRQYDTQNTGWSGTKGSAALATFGSHPPLTLPWFAGKDASGNFSKTEWENIFSGTSLISNGTYIYDAYNIDREAKSGITGVENYTETSRFKTVTSFAGRVFYSGMSNESTSSIYFSRIVQYKSDLGECFQVNDPTSESISDLLDDDGGVIVIPEAYNITKLHVLGAQIIAFAENGVWAIKGIDDIFRATGYSVSKIGENGLTYSGSFVAEEGNRPYWWSNSGIYTLGISAERQTLTEEPVSLPTIQQFFDAILPEKRAQVRSAYDALNKRVAWFYPDNEETVSGKCTNILWFDELLAAFYPWKISDAFGSPYALTPFYLKGDASTTVDYTVVDLDGNTVVDGAGNTVIVQRSGREYTSSALKVLVRDSTGQLTFAEFTGTLFKDWGTNNYSSFVEAGHNFFGDMTLKKNLIYLTSYCKVTEEGVAGNDVDGYDFIRPSACKASTYWDFKTTTSQIPQDIYRLKMLPIPDGAGAFDYPSTVVTSRIRLRGRGRSMKLRFDSEEGKDFHLLGYDTIAGANRRP